MKCIYEKLLRNEYKKITPTERNKRLSDSIYNKGKKNTENQCKVKQEDDSRVILKQYVENYTNRLEMMKGLESETRKSKDGNNHRRESWRKLRDKVVTLMVTLLRISIINK